LALLALAALMALPGMAQAHGQSIEVAADAGPYHVIFYTFDAISEHEAIRFAWNVTDPHTGERVHQGSASLTALFYDPQGKLVNQTQRPPTDQRSQAATNLVEQTAGFLYTDVTMGGPGKVSWELHLANGTEARFENAIYPGTILGAPGPPPAKTPGFGALVCLASFALAHTLRRRFTSNS
jgi:hypothetical protein